MIPVRNQLLIKPFPADEISSGGIFVPLSVREPSSKGTVVKAGSGTKKKPMYFKEREIVYRVKGHGTEVLINDELHILIEDTAILAKE